MTGPAPDFDPHPLLVRQLARLGLSGDDPPDHDGWCSLLLRVSTAYADADDERYLLERSLEVSSQEMSTLYDELRATSASELAAEHARLLAVTEHSPVGIAECDADGNVLFENPALRETVGRSLVGSGIHASSVAYAPDRHILNDAVRRTWRTGEDEVGVFRIQRPDGALRWLRTRLRALRESSDGRPHWSVVTTDITDEVEAEEARDRLSRLLEAATDVVAMFTPDGTLIHVNRIGCRYLGIKPDAPLDGRTIFDLFDPVSRQTVEHTALPALLRDGTWQGEATLAGPGMSTPTSLLLAAQQRDGRAEYCSAIARDVTELKNMQEALAREATHDALTGLPNRALLLDRLQHALECSDRLESGVAVLYIDLDRVKMVNDSLGHQSGDRVLVQAADRLRECTRLADTVGRLGGDEFVVIGEQIDDPGEGARLAMRVVDAFSEPFDLDGVEAIVTASVGLAFGTSIDDAPSLLRDADVAMYSAKQAGGSRYVLFDTKMRTWVKQRFDTEAALRHAVERGELTAYYQPQLRVNDWSLVGFEALARWTSPELGSVSPECFIPLAEDTGLITGIGFHILDTACRHAAEWSHVPGGSPQLSIAVNVSARQLTQPGLLETVEQTLSETGLDPSRLTLEITESVLVQDPGVAGERLAALRAVGVRLAMDDFGTGYSSLAYLQRFPLDAIKIDQMFIADVTGNGPGATIVSSVIELAHALGFEVVAEGVENEDQLRTLSELGCDVIQGFVFAPALPADEAASWLYAPSTVLIRAVPLPVTAS